MCFIPTHSEPVSPPTGVKSRKAIWMPYIGQYMKIATQMTAGRTSRYSCQDCANRRPRGFLRCPSRVIFVRDFLESSTRSWSTKFPCSVLMDASTLQRTDHHALDEVLLHERVGDERRDGCDDDQCVFQLVGELLHRGDPLRIRIGHLGWVEGVLQQDVPHHQLERVQRFIGEVDEPVEVRVP